MCMQHQKKTSLCVCSTRKRQFYVLQRQSSSSVHDWVGGVTLTLHPFIIYRSHVLLVSLCLLLCLTYHTHGQSANRFRQALLALIRLSNNRPTTTTQRPIRTVQSLPSSLSNSTLPRLSTNDLLAMREEFRVLFRNNVSSKDVLTKELFQKPNLVNWHITFRILCAEDNFPNIFARRLVRILEQVF